MTQQKPNILIKESYLAMIKNSVGTKMFNTLIAEDAQGNLIDIFQNGMYSCAAYVSAVLTFVDFIPRPRATVDSLYEDLKDNENFVEVAEKDLEPGDIIFWEETEFEDGSKNRHVGFYIGDEMAISTSYKEEQVIEHHFRNFNEQSERSIETTFRVASY
jgi:hypothetical protein